MGKAWRRRVTVACRRLPGSGRARLHADVGSSAVGGTIDGHQIQVSVALQERCPSTSIDGVQEDAPPTFCGDPNVGGHVRRRKRVMKR
jgi:hypothetical protein